MGHLPRQLEFNISTTGFLTAIKQRRVRQQGANDVGKDKDGDNPNGKSCEKSTIFGLLNHLF